MAVSGRLFYPVPVIGCAMPRLTARFWVDTYLLRLSLEEISAFVVAHGDDVAGSVLVKLNTLDGKAKVWQRLFDPIRETRVWLVLAEGPEPEVDSAIARQLSFDPDLWVIEVEDRDGRHLLDASGLEA